MAFFWQNPTGSLRGVPARRAARVKWAYHGTPAEKLPSIAVEGLRPLYKGTLFFSPDTYTASLHGGGVESNAPFPSGFLLRFPFPRDAKWVGDDTGETAFVSRRVVPPHLIEVYPEAVADVVDDDLWIAVQRAVCNMQVIGRGERRGGSAGLAVGAAVR